MSKEITDKDLIRVTNERAKSFKSMLDEDSSEEDLFESQYYKGLLDMLERITIS
jgi:hypothetical protein